MLCCAVLCCAVLCCAVLCCAVLCCAMLCYAVLCCAVLCCAVLCCAVRCGAVLCCAVWCSGHRLRLDISSSNYPHFDINMNTGRSIGWFGGGRGGCVLLLCAWGGVSFSCVRGWVCASAVSVLSSFVCLCVSVLFHSPLFCSPFLACVLSTPRFTESPHDFSAPQARTSPTSE